MKKMVSYFEHEPCCFNSHVLFNTKFRITEDTRFTSTKDKLVIKLKASTIDHTFNFECLGTPLLVKLVPCSMMKSSQVGLGKLRFEQDYAFICVTERTTKIYFFKETFETEFKMT